MHPLTKKIAIWSAGIIVTIFHIFMILLVMVLLEGFSPMVQLVVTMTGITYLTLVSSAIINVYNYHQYKHCMKTDGSKGYCERSHGKWDIPKV